MSTIALRNKAKSNLMNCITEFGSARALYMPDKPNLYIYGVAGQKKAVMAINAVLVKMTLEHFFFCTVDDSVYLIGDFIG